MRHKQPTPMPRLLSTAAAISPSAADPQQHSQGTSAPFSPRPIAVRHPWGHNHRCRQIRAQVGQLVIDEAHIVATWGAEFRPDFQALSGYRRQLQAVASEHDYHFRTLLLTATASQSDVEALHTLFTDQGSRCWPQVRRRCDPS